MKKANQFLAVFATEFVEIVSNLNITTQVNMTDDGQIQPLEMPLTVAGFVMDVDEMFVYLSKDGENINQALPLDSIKHIAIVNFNEKNQEILDESDFPNDDGSYH